MQGATICLVHSDYSTIFQSTHPCRVRHSAFFKLVGVSDFNPRTRAGCDVTGTFDTASRFISIHAPVQGATVMVGTQVTVEKVFQSTHPCRVRLGHPLE